MNYTGWQYYQNQNGVNIGIKSPDGTQSILLIDPNVSSWITSGGVPLAAPAFVPQPNVTGFQNALKTGLGGIIAVNTLCTTYPLLSPAIEQQVWADVQALIIDANTKLVINATQYAAIKTAATSNNIPITLP